MRMIHAMAMVITVAAAAGCGGEAGSGSAQEPIATGQYATAIEPIWAQYCYGCHSFTYEALLTETGTCFEDGEVVERPLVAPGVPEESILWMKLANVSEAFAYGREMPPTGEGGLIAIDPESFARIEAWIAAGAPE